MQQKPEKKTQKIYATTPKPFGGKALVMYMQAILLDTAAHLTIAEIQQKVKEEYGFFYKHDTIELNVQSFRYCNWLQLDIKQVRRGTHTHTQSFKLSIIQSKIQEHV